MYDAIALPAYENELLKIVYFFRKNVYFKKIGLLQFRHVGSMYVCMYVCIINMVAKHPVDHQKNQYSVGGVTKMSFWLMLRFADVQKSYVSPHRTEVQQ